MIQDLDSALGGSQESNKSLQSQIGASDTSGAFDGVNSMSDSDIVESLTYKELSSTMKTPEEDIVAAGLDPSQVWKEEDNTARELSENVGKRSDSGVAKKILTFRDTIETQSKLFIEEVNGLVINYPINLTTVSVNPYTAGAVSMLKMITKSAVTALQCNASMIISLACQIEYPLPPAFSSALLELKTLKSTLG